MELEPRKWINSYGVEILEGVSEIHYTNLGGELIVHGEMTFSCEDKGKFNLNSKELNRIISKKSLEQQSSYGYIVSDTFWISCMYNMHQNIKYGNPINLKEFFEENNIINFHEVTPSILINCNHAQWGWSKDRDPSIDEDDLFFKFGL